MQLNSVVLPAPFGPITAETPPAGIEKDTSWSACTPAKLTPNALTRSAVSCAVSCVGQAIVGAFLICERCECSLTVLGRFSVGSQPRAGTSLSARYGAGQIPWRPG